MKPDPEDKYLALVVFAIVAVMCGSMLHFAFDAPPWAVFMFGYLAADNTSDRLRLEWRIGKLWAAVTAEPSSENDLPDRFPPPPPVPPRPRA